MKKKLPVCNEKCVLKKMPVLTKKNERVGILTYFSLENKCNEIVMLFAEMEEIFEHSLQSAEKIMLFAYLYP